MDLHQWGYTPELQRHLPPGLAPARVARQDRTGHLVVHERGETFARLPRHLRDDPPVVGDWVGLDGDTIRAVLPRRTAFTRAAAGRETRAQVVAANVDVAFLVTGLDADYNPRRLERYLVLARASGATPVILLNKADLAAAPVDEVRALAPGVEVIAVSARTGAGLEQVHRHLHPGVTAAFLGSSGVGKSSLVNALLGREALATQPVREHDARGRHTTTARHLVPLPGGAILLDTPGMRELQLWDAQESMGAIFAEIEALAAGCRFRDCAHDREPGCAVRENVGEARLASWRKLQREAAASARRADVAAERKASREFGRMGRDAMRAKRQRLDR